MSRTYSVTIVVFFLLALGVFRVDAQVPRVRAQIQPTMRIGRTTNIARKIEALREAIVATIEELKAQARELNDTRSLFLASTDTDEREMLAGRINDLLVKMEATTVKLEQLKQRLDELMAQSKKSNASKAVKVATLRKGKSIKTFVAKSVKFVQRTIGSPKSYRRVPHLNNRIHTLGAKLRTLGSGPPKGSKKVIGNTPAMGGLDIE